MVLAPEPVFSGPFRAFLPILQGPLMGDCLTEPLRPQFDRRLRLEFHGAKVTSDACPLAYRELDDALDLAASAAAQLQDTRTGQNSRHSLTARLRQSSIAAWSATRISTTPNDSASTPP